MSRSAYRQCVTNSERLAWVLDDVVPQESVLSFERPYLPTSMSRSCDVLRSPEERLLINHITSHAYVNLFSFVEEYIIGVAMQHAMAEMFGDPHALRALCRMTDEEVKHQQLFERYRTYFRRDFDCEFRVLENAVEVANRILSRSPMAVMLITLQLELSTQEHYVASVRSAEGIDELFRSVLRAHWQEEAQHSKIDALEIERLALSTKDELREAAIADYVEILGDLGSLLEIQARLDMETFTAITGNTKTDELFAHQVEDYRRLFQRAGLRSPLLASAATRGCGVVGWERVTKTYLDEAA